VQQRKDEPPREPTRDQKRRNLFMAIFLFAVAAGFYLAFFWSVSHRH
jgi:hypothetical protein